MLTRVIRYIESIKSEMGSIAHTPYEYERNNKCLYFCTKKLLFVP